MFFPWHHRLTKRKRKMRKRFSEELSFGYQCHMSCLRYFKVNTTHGSQRNQTKALCMTHIETQKKKQSGAKNVMTSDFITFTPTLSGLEMKM